MVGDLLGHTDTHRSMRPDGIHQRALKELVDVLAKSLSINYQQSLLTREILVDRKLVNLMPICKKS